MNQLVIREQARSVQDGNEPLPAYQLVDTSASQPEKSVPLEDHAALFTLLDRDTLLLGARGDVLTGGAPAILNEDPKTSTPCTVAALPCRQSGAEGKIPFVGVLSLKNVQPGDLERVTVRSRGHSHAYVLKHGPMALQAFLEGVGKLASQSGADVANSLLDALITAKANYRGLDIAAAIIRKIARKDGFVEMLGAFDEDELYLQGWTKDLPAGTSRVFVATGNDRSRLVQSELTCGRFERKDLAGKAHGFCGLLSAENLLTAEGIIQVFYRGRNGWNSIDVHERRSLLDGRALPAQIRALLPGLSLPSTGGREKLLAASQRFDGRETVSELEMPVRLGIDFSARIDAGGVFICGWLLNPEDRVACVLFRGKRISRRLDETWITQLRPDVSSAFEDLSPFLRGMDASHRHGFLVHVACEPDDIGDAPYFELVLKNGHSAYVPVALAQSSLRGTLKKLVSTLDPVVAQSASVIETQLLPMLQAHSAPEPTVGKVTDFGSFPDICPTSVVIGLDETIDRMLVLLPLFALDPFLREMPLVVSGPAPSIAEQMAEIRRLAEFYELKLRIVQVSHVEDKLDALQAGLQVAPSEAVVCMSADLVPRTSGWLEQLLAVFEERKGKQVVAPTLLYEDETIRWAGAWIDGEDDAPDLKQHYVGYPRRTLQGVKGSDVDATTFDCCILPRAFLGDAGGFTRAYLGTDEKSFDAALKLRRNGVLSYWAPEVEMVLPENGAGAEQGWRRLSATLDRHVFDRLWAGALCDLREEAQ
ncbi:MAG: glycosyltransferase [Roseibium sp.]|uniref:glycosyltransferase n=1 Tax=Roseibium sp. TaxID=1936156 RepID=UPI0026188481|nr:glycosyltransferase [Roseibium sp.]MCV0425183.1 glycosyltransferase [Roseibium sp.]